jgi:hypothetical protein
MTVKYLTKNILHAAFLPTDLNECYLNNGWYTVNQFRLFQSAPPNYKRRIEMPVLDPFLNTVIYTVKKSMLQFGTKTCI